MFSIIKMHTFITKYSLLTKNNIAILKFFLIFLFILTSTNFLNFSYIHSEIKFINIFRTSFIFFMSLIQL